MVVLLHVRLMQKGGFMNCEIKTCLFDVSESIIFLYFCIKASFKMQINYIYTPEGEVEYAVIPILIWEKVKDYAHNIDIQESKQDFYPSKYKGLLSKFSFDVNSEIKSIRDEWNRTF